MHDFIWAAGIDQKQELLKSVYRQLDKDPLKLGG